MSGAEGEREDWRGLLRRSPRARFHAGAAVLIAVVLPAGSWVDGSGALAWTMFSKSATYRLTAFATERGGQRVPWSAAEVARFADRKTAYFLRGSDAWKHAPVGRKLRQGLGPLAQQACQRGGLASIELTLEERAHLDDAVRTTSVRVACP